MNSMKLEKRERREGTEELGREERARRRLRGRKKSVKGFCHFYFIGP